MSAEVGSLVDHLFRRESGKLIAVLTRLFGFRNIEIAEDIVQETLLAAFKSWSYGSVPHCPEAWLMAVAKNKAINYLNREKYHSRLRQDLARDVSVGEENHSEIFFDIEDSMLRLMFVCCHPCLAEESQLALILKTLGGFSSREVARALMVREEAINKRIYRAKQEIQQRQIGFEFPRGRGPGTTTGCGVYSHLPPL